MAGKIERRDFIKTSIAAGTIAASTETLGAPEINTQSNNILGANDQIRIGMIGCGDQSNWDATDFVRQPNVKIVALCDVYEGSIKQTLRNAALKLDSEKTPYFKDFRRILDDKNIDAVIVATPDHWHALPTIMACQAGKDVYVEKPLSLTVVEGRKMLEAARKHNRVVQTGSQQRSGPHYQKAVKLIQEGRIGPVHKISAGYTRNAMPGFKYEEILTKELPKELDWEMWLGPAPYVPYDPFRCHYHFRWFWDYSGGQMTNWGAHNLDIARWALNAKAPMAVSAFGGRYEIKDGGETPDVQEVLYNFASGEKSCVVSWSGREVNRTRDEYLVFHGTKGTLNIMRNGFTIAPETWRKKEKPEIEPMQMKGDGNEAQALHIRNFLDCVKSRQRPIADVEEGHLTARSEEHTSELQS